MKKLLFGALALAVASGAASAQGGDGDSVIGLPGESYFSALGGFSLPDSERVRRGTRRIGGHATGIAGYQWHNNFGVELNISGESIRRGGHRATSSIDGYYGLGNRQRGHWVPYVLAGVGVSANSIGGRNAREFDFLANVGVGVVVPVTSIGSLRVRTETRYVYDRFRDGLDDWRFSIGLELPVFHRAVVDPVVETVEVSRPAPPPPPPPAPQVIAPDPCDVGRITQLPGVTFEFDSARLQRNAITVLETTLDMLLTCDELRFEVAGHTDSVGAVGYNMRLSQRRAESVRSWFIDEGVAGDRLTARGYGPTEPIASNETDEGRERNRRVELRLLRD